MVKVKKILALSMTLVTVNASVMTAWGSDPTQEFTSGSTGRDLTQEFTSGSTEVVAHIEDEQIGEVQYTVRVPDRVDFGTLTQPETDEDSFKDVSFEVTLTKAENLAENQHVKVCVKNQSATEEDGAFYLTQTMSPNTKFKYEVYDVDPVGENNLPIDSTAMTEQGGYLFCSFNTTGASKKGTLRFKQKQLYGKDISEIAGDYSGSMVYTISVSTE